MTIDKLSLYNYALDMVGETALSALTENRGPRFLLDRVWARDVVKYCLEQGQWQFATRTVRLDADTSIEPDFGLRYAFERPEDYVRTVAVSGDEYFSEPETRYADEGGYFSADYDMLYVKYVSDDDDYGRNYTLWPQSFFTYVAARMAWEIIPRLVNSRSTRKDMEDIMAKELSSAQGKDGTNRPTRFPSRGAWAHARHGRGTPFNRERR